MIITTFFRNARIALVVFIAAAMVIHVTVRDSFTPTGIVFYATPLPVLAILSVLGGVGWFVGRWRRLGISLVLSGALVAGWWVHVAWYRHVTPAGESGPRVLFWNTCHGWAGWPGIAQEIAEAGADVIGLVEADQYDGGRRESLLRVLPGYQLSSFQWDIGLAVRGQIESSEVIRLGPHGKCKLFHVVLASGPLNVVVVDMKSNPFVSRRERFKRLARLMETLRDRPAVVMGDFNTPQDSPLFDPIRRDYQNAFEAAGNGLFTTWPVPAPVLAIDHLWVSPQLSVRSCQLGWSMRSDHRSIVAELGGQGPTTSRAGP